jgi:hypothetical protein
MLSRWVGRVGRVWGACMRRADKRYSMEAG